MKQITAILVLYVLGVILVNHPNIFNMLLTGVINLFGMMLIGILNTILFFVNSLL